MARPFAAAVALAVVALAGCGGPTPPTRGALPVVTVEPAATLDAVPAVARVRVRGAAGVKPPALRLFSGDLDSYYVGRIRAADLPSTLLERAVPAIAWDDPTDGSLVLAPSVPLEPGAGYGVAALGWGAVGRFVVTAVPGAYLPRVWPPEGAVEGGKRWVFCGEAPLPPPGRAVMLEPARVTAVVGAGADSAGTDAAHCFHLDLAVGSTHGAAVAPPLLDGVALDPSPVLLARPEDGGAARAGAPLVVGAPGTPSANGCVPGETPFGPACAVVMDDRAVVRNGVEPLLWTLSVTTMSVVVSVDAGERFVVRGFVPSARITVSGTVATLDGAESPVDEELVTEPPRPHVVLNEVLANPSGPDRSQEWVELVNDGDSAVALTGWTLEDGSGASPLPAVTLAPGSFALVVPSAYDIGSLADVPAAAGTLIVRVPELGGGGLSNQGETLRLRDRTGRVVSAFPALAAAKSGVSIARREPWSLDDDASAFGPSAPPGATPGAANVLVMP
jgi:hypothetical protein